MSTGDASVDLPWAGDTRHFRLGIADLRELQGLRDAGPAQLYERIAGNAWRIEDLREVIRLGLLGGGMKREAVSEIVRRYCDNDEASLFENATVARAVLLAALIGPPRESADEPEKAPAEPSGPDASTSPGSTVPGS